MLICPCIFYGYFQVTMAELLGKRPYSLQSQNIYHLALYRKSLPDLCFTPVPKTQCLLSLSQSNLNPKISTEFPHSYPAVPQKLPKAYAPWVSLGDE